MAERGVRGIDFNLGQDRRERHFERQQVAQFLFDQIADHAFGLCAEDIERIGRDFLVGRALRSKQADLRPVAMRYDDLVAGCDARDLGGGNLHVFALLVFRHRLAALQERVAA